jgi:hypothetical protein
MAFCKTFQHTSRLAEPAIGIGCAGAVIPLMPFVPGADVATGTAPNTNFGPFASGADPTPLALSTSSFNAAAIFSSCALLLCMAAGYTSPKQASLAASYASHQRRLPALTLHST